MLDIKNLSIDYDGEPIVKNVNFQVGENETVCIVGESGSGKSTVLKGIIGLLNVGGIITNGQILYDQTDLTEIPKNEFRKYRGQQIAMIFQQAGRSLDPVVKIGKQFHEALLTKGKISRKESDEIAIVCMKQLSLRNPERILNSYPPMLSGGMNQRVAIAMVMVMEPRLILADEPTSAQDVTVQVEIVESIRKLKENTGASLLLVTHSMGVVAHLADKVGVMYDGCMVEWGTRDQILKNPVHPYTQVLMDAVLRMDGKAPKVPKKLGTTEADCEYCSFYPRCSYRNENCKSVKDRFVEIEKGHYTVCSMSAKEEAHG